MAKQRNVAQQNQDTLDEIRRAAASAALHRWLPAVLGSHGLDPAQGVLVQVLCAPDQLGDDVDGTWLTHDGQFWAFSVTVSRATGALLTTDRFEDVTAHMAEDDRPPGAGRSFGSLALEVLRAGRR